MHIRKTRASEIVPVQDPDALLPQYKPVPILRPPLRNHHHGITTAAAGGYTEVAYGPMPKGGIVRNYIAYVDGEMNIASQVYVRFSQASFYSAVDATILAMKPILPTPLERGGVPYIQAQPLHGRQWLDINAQLDDDSSWLYFMWYNPTAVNVLVGMGFTYDQVTQRDM